MHKIKAQFTIKVDHRYYYLINFKAGIESIFFHVKLKLYMITTKLDTSYDVKLHQP